MLYGEAALAAGLLQVEARVALDGIEVGVVGRRRGLRRRTAHGYVVDVGRQAGRDRARDVRRGRREGVLTPTVIVPLMAVAAVAMAAFNSATRTFVALKTY